MKSDLHGLLQEKIIDGIETYYSKFTESESDLSEIIVQKITCICQQELIVTEIKNQIEKLA